MHQVHNYTTTYGEQQWYSTYLGNCDILMFTSNDATCVYVHMCNTVGYSQRISILDTL